MSPYSPNQSGPIALVLYVFIIVLISAQAVASDPQAAIDHMLKNGFELSKSRQLYSQWSSAKNIVIDMANSGDPKQVELAFQICRQRYPTVARAMSKGIQDVAAHADKPLDALVPTGSWKSKVIFQGDPSRLADKQTFIRQCATSDIDLTNFSMTGNAEAVTERAMIHFTEMTTGRRVIAADGSIDTGLINKTMTSGEVTLFPRDPNGKMSPDFAKKYPHIVHESYPGAAGQRALEHNYMLNPSKNCKADIVRYDKHNKPILNADGDVVLLKDQPTESVMENLSDAKYNHMDRARIVDADYEIKYKGHLAGMNDRQRADHTAKMLQRMLDDDAKVTGINPATHPDTKDLYDKARLVKDAVRTGDDDALKAALKGQSLDDFLRQADDEMMRINLNNKRRLTGLVDDAFESAPGSGVDAGDLAQSSRMANVAKGLTLLGYGYTAADAFIKARPDERRAEVGKALVSAVAADAASNVVGSALAAAGKGTAATMGAGFAAAFVTGLVVKGGLDITQDCAEAIAGGYKTDAVMSRMFLEKDKLKAFLTMSPDEIRRQIDKEWEIQYQYGGMYYGRSGDADAQASRKKEIYEKALKAQSSIIFDTMQSRVLANIVADELADIARRFDSGEIDAYDLDKERERLNTNFKDVLDTHLSGDYKNYRVFFSHAGQTPERGGAWDAMFGDDKQKALDRQAFDARLQTLLDEMAFIEGSLGDFDGHAAALSAILRNEGDPAQAAELLAQLQRDRDDLSMNMATIESGAASCMITLNTTYGVDDDITAFHNKKNILMRLLMNFPREVKNRLAVFAALEEQYNLFKMMADLKQKDEEEAAALLAAKKQPDDLPAWAKKSGAGSDDTPGQDDPPSFVSKTTSGNETDDEDEFGSDKDDYAIKAIAIDTVDVDKDGRIYTRLRDSDAATVIIRMRGSDHIIDGSEAVDLLMEKGYLHYVAGVGLVTTSRYAAFSDDTGSHEEEKASSLMSGRGYRPGWRDSIVDQSVEMDAETMKTFGGTLTKEKKKSSISDLYGTKKGWQDGIVDKKVEMDDTTKKTYGGAVK